MLVVLYFSPTPDSPGGGTLLLCTTISPEEVLY